MKTINVCIGSACHLKGAYGVINKFEKLLEDKKLEDKVELKAAFCLGECTKAVSVKIDDGPVHSLTEEKVEEFLEKQVL
ncbi:NAD(P)H-dependent oxidoreductase subunit E [Proteinivorax tanatarense]|uniref:NAD(P)H-dependent oxidoreductase subunit E n=1 Tax=Proteinivorax tanatarense TaxID=1260629 RepID=A0AAU7VKR4_9FIRM